MSYVTGSIDLLLFAILPFVVIVGLPVRLVQMFPAGNPVVRVLCIGLGLLWASGVLRIGGRGFLSGPEFSRHSIVAPELWMLVAIGWAVAEGIVYWPRKAIARAAMQDPVVAEAQPVPPRTAWPTWAWGVVFAMSMFVATSFGTTPTNRNDTGLLWTFLVLQAVAGTLWIRLVASLLGFRPSGGWFGKLLAVIALAVVLFGLSLCSTFARNG